MKTVIQLIEEALKADQECLVKNFRLVRVILPTELMEELRARTKEVVMPPINSLEGLKVTMCSIPVEEDKCARRIRYVIEGDLQIL